MTDTPAADALIARGGDADVFAIDETRVLRRYRRREVPEREVAIRPRGHYRRTDGNVSDKERDRLTKLRL